MSIKCYIKNEGHLGYGVYDEADDLPIIARMGLTLEEAEEYKARAEAPVEYDNSCTGRSGCQCYTCRMGM